MTDCIFCKIVAGDVPAQKIYDNDKIIAFLDVAPTNPGHTLIVPKAHHADFLETPDDIINEIMAKAKKIAPVVVEAVKADGFNLIANTKPAAGQVVFHTHFHIIPRFANDGLKHWPKKDVSPEEMKKIQEDIKAKL